MDTKEKRKSHVRTTWHLCRFVTACMTLVCVLFAVATPHALAKKIASPRILFVPHDSRPISNAQTADTIRQMKWEIDTPPLATLGGRDRSGDAEAIWAWLEKEAKTAQIAVLSADTLLYGSLVDSRKHVYSMEDIEARIERFQAFKKKYPKLKLYVFSSIMRTPRTAEASGGTDVRYYAHYGSDIFRYTALVDKKETESLTRREQKELAFLQKLIPQAALDDWLERHKKNFRANEMLIDLRRAGVFEYLALGRDDNAPYSQTHMESRKLSAYGKDLDASKFQAMAGIDEFAMMMLTRAVNDWTGTIPFVFVKYNWGRGGDTVPSYSDEKISDSIRAHTVAAGGMVVPTPDRADFILCVNTNQDGKTGEASERTNTEKPRRGTKYFVDILEEQLATGKPVLVSDIAYANGADNAFMAMMKARGLLFRIRAYSGWNTATNSTGFVLCQGMLSAHMDERAHDLLLRARYIDDWAYQANVRTVIARQLGWLRASGSYSTLGERREAAEDRTTRFMRRFCDENLPPDDDLPYLTVSFPWNRMFEAEFTFPRPFSFRAQRASAK